MKNSWVLWVILMMALPSCQYRQKHLDKVVGVYSASQLDQYIQDVAFISKMPRVSGGAHHKAVQQMCVKRFSELGFQVELHNYGTGLNVIGTLVGKQKPAEKIYLSAHYDSVPNCNGADDNASGVAGVFATAAILVSKPHNRTLVVACWDEEEKKTVGSKAYVVGEAKNNADIKMSYVYEMIGYKNEQPDSQQIPKGFELLYSQQVNRIQNNHHRGDFIALVYNESAAIFLSDIAGVAKANNLAVMPFKVSSLMKKSTLISDLRRSDHSVFWDEDYPAVMITDTANFRNQNYHCLKGEDNADSLDNDFALKIVNTISVMIEKNLK